MVEELTEPEDELEIEEVEIPDTVPEDWEKDDDEDS